jgi:hypothetical protein
MEYKNFLFFIFTLFTITETSEIFSNKYLRFLDNSDKNTSLTDDSSSSGGMAIKCYFIEKSSLSVYDLTNLKSEFHQN